MGWQMWGGQSAKPAEVETNSLNLRATLRPNDLGSGGSYATAQSNSTGAAAAQTTAAPIWSCRYGATKYALPRRISVSLVAGGTAFAAGVALLQLYKATAFTVADTGGATLAGLATNKMVTAQAATGMADIRILTTAALTPGTRTLDTAPLASLVLGVPGTAYAQLVARQALWERRAAEQWLALAQNEGLVMMLTTPATGTFFLGVDFEWDEVSTIGTALAA